MKKNALLVILYILSTCISTASFSNETTISTEWVSSTELNKIRSSHNENRSFPSLIEGRISDNKLQFKAKFSPFPYGMDKYYSIWGHTNRSYELNKQSFLSKGYEQYSHSTFTDLSDNVLHQATWLLYEKPPKTFWEELFELIFGNTFELNASTTPVGIKTVTDDTLNKTIESSEGYLLIHFSSYDPNCGYCIASNEYINKLSIQHELILTVTRMTWEPWNSYKSKSKEITKQYQIVGIPKFILLNNGTEIWRATGNTDDNKNKLEELLVGG